MEWKAGFLCLITWLVSSCAFAAEIEAVYNVEIKGTTYPVVEVVAVQRDPISKWNILKGKRGPAYHAYRVLDSDYPVRFYDQDWIPNKSQFKDVPDRRAFDKKHPYAPYIMSAGNNIISFVSLFL